jgi:hypothetical protein
MISAIENSNKFRKTRFWKEKSVEDMVTLGPMAQDTLVLSSAIYVTTYLPTYVIVHFQMIIKGSNFQQAKTKQNKRMFLLQQHGHSFVPSNCPGGRWFHLQMHHI